MRHSNDFARTSCWTPDFYKVVLTCAFVVVSVGLCSAQSGLQPLPEIIDSAGKSVALLATLDDSGNYQEKYGCFFVNSNGVFITSYQAIAETDVLEVILPDGRKTRDVSVVGIDPRKDIAILKIDMDGLPAVPLGDSDKTRVGETVLVLSRPLGTFVSATNCIISSIRDSKRGLKLHQLSIPVDRIATGGPALNERGEVVGIVSYYSLFQERLGFIVPINYGRGLLSDQPSMTFAEFVKNRKPFQPFDPAVVEAKRLEILDKVRVATFQMRDARVKWEQVNEVTDKLKTELLKQLNAYGTTSSEIFLADPFEVAEHRRLIASLYFNFGELFAVKDASPSTLFPLTNGMLSATAPSVFPKDMALTGKKGEPKGKITKVTVSYTLFTYLPLFSTTANLTAAIELSALLSRLSSSEEMPNLSLNVFYTDPSDGKEKEAESIWSLDAYTVKWDEIKDRRVWDLQEKMRVWKEHLRKEKAASK